MSVGSGLGRRDLRNRYALAPSVSRVLRFPKRGNNEMLNVVACITRAHDPWLVGLAAVVCILACYAAFEIAGTMAWNPALVTASVAIGILFGATALPTGLNANTEKWKAVGAVLLALAICGHHFIAMAAISITPDPTVEIPRSALPAE